LRDPGESAPPSRAPSLASSGLSEDAKHWGRVLARYAEPDPKRSLFELLVTAVPFVLLWLSVLLCLQRGLWLGLVLTVPAGGFLVRLFLIQHDCGHGSFFRDRRSNDFVGRMLGVLTLTPYGYWRRTHAVHHATTGNLDRRGIGDVTVLTVAEYRSLRRWRRVAYRLMRHPLVLLGLGPFYLFVLKYRLPVGLMQEGRGPWISTLGTDLAIAGVIVAAGVTVGFGSLLLVQLPVTLIAGSIGVWLFYVQHQFADAYWAREDEWSFYTGALLGSTHYELPAVLRWLTANIGIHHVHHLASRIPSYRLSEALADHPELRPVGRLTFRESLRCFRLALWDEEAKRLVAFRDLQRQTPCS
jgi:omega-6 fatty acid desaturase (delta-12 desaturase)